MFQIRFHGRGGQGAVTAAELLSVAAFNGGQYAQAFPSFGSERMGAPVAAFCRIAEHPIRTREPVITADAVVIQDATLLHAVEVFQGLRESGWVLVNTARDVAALGLGDLEQRMPAGHVRAVPATELAKIHMGRPLPNAVLLGALAALTGTVSLACLHGAIRSRFEGAVADANVAAATAGYDCVGRRPPC
jgi:pyruvate ferredoxin oxidoreductase gamma subunit